MTLIINLFLIQFSLLLFHRSDLALTVSFVVALPAVSHSLPQFCLFFSAVLAQASLVFQFPLTIDFLSDGSVLQMLFSATATKYNTDSPNSGTRDSCDAMDSHKIKSVVII